MSNNEGFDENLKQLALSYAKEPLAHCGEVVTTLWGSWKNEHKVMIYRVGAEIVSLSGGRCRHDNESLEDYRKEVPIMGVEHCYSALRLGKNGIPKERYGIALTNFRTEDGYSWEKMHRDFNHSGLSFTIEEIPEENRVE